MAKGAKLVLPDTPDILPGRALLFEAMTHRCSGKIPIFGTENLLDFPVDVSFQAWFWVFVFFIVEWFQCLGLLVIPSDGRV